MSEVQPEKSTLTVDDIKGMTVADLKLVLANRGVNVQSQEFASQVKDVEQRAIDQAEQDNTRKRPKIYEILKSSALTLRDGIALLANGLIVVIGYPIAIALLFISEYTAVLLGILTFFNDERVSAFLALATIISYFALVWYKHTAMRQYEQQEQYAFSLVQSRDSFYYLLGIPEGFSIGRVFKNIYNRLMHKPIEKQNKWRPKPTIGNEVKSVNTAIRYIMIVVIVLGVLGRLEDEMSLYSEMTWHEALTHIATESNLEQFFEYTGAAMLSFSLLAATHFLIHYLNSVYHRAAGATETEFFDEKALKRKIDDDVKQYLFYRIVTGEGVKNSRVAAPTAPKQIKASVPSVIEQPVKNDAVKTTAKKAYKPKGTLNPDGTPRGRGRPKSQPVESKDKAAE